MTLHRPAAALLAAAGLIAALTATVPAASADQATDAPVTAPDRVTLRGGGLTFVDVADNDTDPNGDDLEVCRIEAPRGAPLDVQLLEAGAHGYLVAGRRADDASQVVVNSTSYEPGSYQVTYWACDRDYLTPGTLTVTVARTKPVRARKVAPSVVRFVNPDDRAVRVFYFAVGAESSEDPRRFRLAPGASRRVRAEGRVLVWSASARGGRAGDGLVRGLSRP